MEQNDLSFVPRERRLEIDKILRERESELEEKTSEEIIAENLSFEEFAKRLGIDDFNK